MHHDSRVAHVVEPVLDDLRSDVIRVRRGTRSVFLASPADWEWTEQIDRRSMAGARHEEDGAVERMTVLEI